MDGRGRALDNVFIERLWRSLKYELIYPGDFVDGPDLFQALDRYFHFYHHQRPHQGHAKFVAQRFLKGRCLSVPMACYRDYMARSALIGSISIIYRGI